MTIDSFSDGGRFLNPLTALAHAKELHSDGATTIDIGAVSSNPEGADVSIEEEIQRLEAIVPALLADNISVSIDSFRTEVQRHFLNSGIEFLNDISGFKDSSFYTEIADSRVKLVIMHSIQSGRAQVETIEPESILPRLIQFFDDRITALEKAGIAKSRMIVDPGMGHFIGSNPNCSIEAIRAIPELKKRYQVGVLVGVSRKSFLGRITGREVHQREAATLAAEIACIDRGADYIRTHNPKGLIDMCRVREAIDD